MRKFFLSAVIVGLLLLLIGLASLSVIISAYSSCVYINFNRPDRNVVLFGRVERVREQDGWIMTRLRLCGSGLTGAAAVEVLTPVKVGLVDIGEEAQYRGQPIFHWVKQNMSTLTLIEPLVFTQREPLVDSHTFPKSECDGR